MRTQIAVLCLLALVASAHCQTAPATTSCLREAYDLGESIKLLLVTKDFSNISGLVQILAKVNTVARVCGEELAEIRRGSSQNLQKISINLNCIAQILQSIDKIKKLKGSFKGGIDFGAVAEELRSLGQDVSALKAACTK